MAKKKSGVGAWYVPDREWRIAPTPDPDIVRIDEFHKCILTTAYLKPVGELPQWVRESIALIDLAGGSLPGVGFKHPQGVTYYLEYKGE